MNTSEKSFDEIKSLISDLNLLVVTANDVETFHVRQVLKSLPDFVEVLKVPHKNHTYFLGLFGQYQCIHVQCGNMGSMNSTGATLTISNAIDEWKPKVVVMVGVAMGIDETKQQIGDVLISETIIHYENQRVGSKRAISRGGIVSASDLLLNRFRNVTDWSYLLPNGNFAKQLPGQILSGEKLIDNLTFRNHLLRNYPQAIGAEMEGAGVYAACRNKNVHEWILVKGICDYGDGNKSVDKQQRQNLAALCATSLCLKVFESKVGFADASLYPVAVKKTGFQSEEIATLQTNNEEEIMAIIESPVNKKEDMHTPIQLTVSAFLELSSYQKAIVINDLGINLASLTNLNAHEMDKEFFRQVKSNNLLPVLWNAINIIKPFKTDKNPFV